MCIRAIHSIYIIWVAAAATRHAIDPFLGVRLGRDCDEIRAQFATFDGQSRRKKSPAAELCAAFIKIEARARARTEPRFIRYSICEACALTLKRRGKPTAADRYGALKGKRDQSNVNACKRASEITPS